MEFCDLKSQYALLKDDIDKRIMDVLAHGRYIFGPEITELEERCAGYAGVKKAIAVASGTDALLAGLMAYDVKPGDYVITTPFTFIATAEMIALLGAKPLFVDIEDRTCNIDPEALKALLANLPAEKERVKGVIAVDLYGQLPDYEKLQQVIDDSGLDLFLMEDAAQSFGATQRGNRAGSFGDVAATSFFPAKPLGCYGDGGMIFTDNEELAEKIIWIRNHGQNERYRHKLVGINGRLDSIQAAVLLGKFDTFVNEEVRKRDEVAEIYTTMLKSVKQVKTPVVEEINTSVWAQYSLMAERRDELQKFLGDKGIPSAIHYPVPLHRQEVFIDLGCGEGTFPVAEKVSESIISLPMCAYKKNEDIEAVVTAVREFYGA
ncbi:DegT/DnrJ/EryC1/StrS family aminotransferase [Limisalsivibrio acetivorans]|uniref:DegT/DnrJ/EryC1/StrS family aminotransferase n=1 Tax=Limisalsivibrio acetivorans TaxID=1304888 RepID=UPI0003B5CA66|nr:DegT/DnrJ/EryC1/StrS family aminotransferase [Limisalsivibrio acetivorans]